jgi:hypothetical protein
MNFKNMSEKLSKSKFLKNNFALALIACLVLLVAMIIPLTMAQKKSSEIGNAHAAASELFVDPSGSDSNAGTDPTTPLKTIQAALNKATPGMTINLAPGLYNGAITTVVDGTAAAPITIKGPETGKDLSGRSKAVVYGTGHIVGVNNSYYVFEGFTIEGQETLSSTTYPTTLDAVRSFKDSVQGQTINDKLLYVGSSDTSHDITGVVVNDMYLHASGGECVRLRNRTTHAEIKNSVIAWCGMYPSGDDVSKYKYHNAEGIYIGTSPKSTDQPMYANDSSAYNSVHDNTIYTYGTECFEVKENAHDNTLSNNDCRYNDEPYSFLGSNIELRGYNNNILGNTIMGSRSVGLKMASDSTSYTQGGNTAQNNNFSQIANESIYNKQSTAQGLFCGNTFTGTVLSGNAVGNPTAPCPLATGLPTTTPVASSTPTPVLLPTATATPAPTSIPFSTPTAIPTPTKAPATISVRVSQSSDDAEEVITNGKVNLTDSDFQMVTNSGKQQQDGMRFQHIQIPKGAVITNAYIVFTANSGDSGATTLIFNGDATANSTTFTTANHNITSRTKTSAAVTWNPVPVWVSSTTYQTPNLSTVIQQIVNNSGWTTGNSLSIIISGSGKRVSKSYDSGSATAPLLVITYQ